MLRSIRFKLWLTLALAMIISLGGVLGLTHYTTYKRFVSYSFQAFKEQLPPLERALQQSYQSSSSWQAFKNDRNLWRRTVLRSMIFDQQLANNLHNTREDGQAKNYKSEQNLKKILFAKGFRSNQKRFLKSLSLYDKNRNLVSGAAQKKSQLVWRSIELNNALIGYIAFEKPNHVLRRNEAVFLQQQLTFFVFLSFAMALAALVLSAFISRWFLAPIADIGTSAKKVAEGDFSHKIHYNKQDELGELCTSFNNMSEKLQTTEAARHQWLADISHEMRTPIAVLKGQIEAIQDGVRPASTKNIGLLGQKIDELNTLVNDLFELSLSDVGELSMQLVDIDIDELLAQFFCNNKERAELAGLNWQLTRSGSPTLISGDTARLTQILNNILENSLRYTDAGGQINWQVSRRDHCAELTLEDSSPGVDNKDLSRLFDRLFRVEQSRNRNTGGAGLGLSLCKNLIEAQAGKISASRSNLGGLKLTLSFDLKNQYD